MSDSASACASSLLGLLCMLMGPLQEPASRDTDSQNFSAFLLLQHLRLRCIERSWARSITASQACCLLESSHFCVGGCGCATLVSPCACHAGSQPCMQVASRRSQCVSGIEKLRSCNADAPCQGSEAEKTKCTSRPLCHSHAQPCAASQSAAFLVPKP